MTNTIAGHGVPDGFRAAQFIKELKQFEAEEKMPELIIICLPNDHTSGTSAGAPTPAHRWPTTTWPSDNRRGHQPQQILEGHVYLRD